MGNENARYTALSDGRQTIKRVSLFDRWDDSEVETLVDTIDGEDKEINSEKNKSPSRWSYRRRLKITTASSGDWDSIQYVFSRALNPTTVLFIGPTLIYPGTYCLVELLTGHNMWYEVGGIVKNCRYVGDRAYEVIVRFEKSVELPLFVPEAESRRVLVVDDEETSRSLIALHLERLNVEFVAVDCGDDALEAAKEQKFDVILLDVDMPQPDGFETLSMLRQAGTNAVVAAVTSYTTDEMRQRCIDAGFDSYVPKPISRAKLQAVMHTQAEPIFSAFAQDEGMASLIGRFATNAMNVATELWNAATANDFDALARAARRLKADAGGCGFDPVAERAAALEELVAENADPQETIRAVNEVISLLKQVRAASAG